jgi:two-component system cell cycle sensor histidine kinase/response regulator CckA
MNALNKKNIILFIDDEKICHTLVELIIPNFTNYRLVGAFNGQEAINLAKRYSSELCLILSDIILPDINGYEILKILRQDERFAQTPFIFQSGLASQEKSLRKNISEDIKIIYKPYKQADLLKSIDEALTNS